jgi:methionine-gamma-lyase
VYGGTYAFLHDFLPEKTGIKTTFVDITDLDAVARAMSQRTKLVFAESVSISLTKQARRWSSTIRLVR